MFPANDAATLLAIYLPYFVGIMRSCAIFMQCALLVPQPEEARALQQKRQRAARRKARKAVAAGGDGVSGPGTSVSAVAEDSDED